MKVPGERRMWVGCTPETCLGGCNKSYFGIRWRDQLYWYAAPCFGSRHGGCVLATLVAPVVRKLKELGCEIIEWVDDWLCVVKNNGGVDHDPKRCWGEEQCEHCRDCFRRAREIEKLVDAGNSITWDCSRVRKTSCRGSWAKAKAVSLATSAMELLDGNPTPRDGAKWRGSLQ
eukprot:3263613-Rhodomonas_salina.1